MTAAYDIAPPLIPARVRTEQTLVTPKLAAEWLKNNEVNRNLRFRVVEMYANDMASGSWQLTGESIKLSTTGRLLDGQHRLSAVVSSGMSVWMFVAHDVPDEAQRVMDSGAKRSSVDVLSMDGVKHAATISAAARIAIAAERGDWKNMGKAYISNSQVLDWIEFNPDICQAADLASAYHRKSLCQPSMIAYSSLLMHRAVGNWEEVDAFWRAAAEKVGLQHGDPVIALTNRFAQDRAQRRQIPKAALLSAILRAWNYRREGKSMMLVKYESSSNSGGFVPIPEIIA